MDETKLLLRIDKLRDENKRLRELMQRMLDRMGEEFEGQGGRDLSGGLMDEAKRMLKIK